MTCLATRINSSLSSSPPSDCRLIFHNRYTDRMLSLSATSSSTFVAEWGNGIPFDSTGPASGSSDARLLWRNSCPASFAVTLSTVLPSDGGIYGNSRGVPGPRGLTLPVPRGVIDFKRSLRAVGDGGSSAVCRSWILERGIGIGRGCWF